jgi:hypothetical protein
LQPFEGSIQRIARAEVHRKTLADVWNQYLEEDPYIPHIRVNDDGSGSISVRAGWNLPTDLSLVLGEFLYQLRAALDGAIYDAVVIASGKNPPPNHQDLQFPICSTADQFNNARKAMIAALSEKCKTQIELFQPYNMPDITPELMVFNFNRSLSILNDWARKDRHRRLHMVASFASEARPKLRLPAGVTVTTFEVIEETVLLENEVTIATFQLAGYGSDMQVEGTPDLCVDITIDEYPRRCYGNDTFSNRLMGISRAVTMAIAGIENNA